MSAVEAILTSLFEPWVGVACLDDEQARFERGRACARLALERLGGPAVQVGVGQDGEPLWPEGWVGSISHASAFSVAAVARLVDARALGVDVEPDLEVSPAFARRVCSDAELARIGELGSRPEELARVVFSAKETVHKLQFPLTREGAGLRRIQVLLEDQRFVATFTESLPPFHAGQVLHGRWRRHAGVIGTAAWLSAALAAQIF